MESKELEIKEKWGLIKSQSDDDIKKIAKDLYNGLIYTDRHCSQHEIMSRFMPLMFMGPQPPLKPSYPNSNNSVENQRDNAIYDLIQRDLDQEKYEEDYKWYELEMKYYKENYLTSIGLIYEFLSEAGPMGLNGGPMFMSLRLLNKEDAEKMFSFYETYKELREKVDSF
jgi:hypothetical protein